MADRVERLTNLLALLLETQLPLSLVEISGALEGQYPEVLASRANYPQFASSNSVIDAGLYFVFVGRIRFLQVIRAKEIKSMRVAPRELRERCAFMLEWKLTY